MSTDLNRSEFSKKKKMYILGFLFSIIFTVIPFFVVMTQFFSSHINYFIIIICSVMQIFVHFLCFLDLNFSIKSRFNMMFLLFSIIIIFIVMFGSIWIIFNLNDHMFRIHH